ncbi:hypothetical protein A6A06_20770 [Streptomyces sp. CB02923]|uniref:hypothetical protein n=1 Tax=Streptomyces sp. CB02923 TaxID=1718985 RepID=UPI00093C40DE|nr:hypothetical protein [Streptomyces sp. CB02923]OKI01243.1 hypothetical protein A6A06_20770 [Streptomyces sp. CB02923]
MSTEALHRLVVNGDVCGSGRLGLRAKLRMREAMYDVFEAGFTAAGVAARSFHMEDRGDGVLVALAPDVPSAQLAGPWLEGVYRHLRQVNEGRSEPLRMRVAMHAGPVAQDARGLAGRAVDLACRLCDSDTARAVMQLADRSPLLFVVSDSLYHDVVAEGGTCIEPEHYRRAWVSEKETDAEAWFHVPRLPFPPLPAQTSHEAPPSPAVPARDRPCATGVRAVQDPVPEQGGGAGHGGTVPPPASGSGTAAGTAPAPAPAPEPATYSTKYRIGYIGGSNQNFNGGTFHGFTTVHHRGAAPEPPPAPAPEPPAEDAPEAGAGPEGGGR